MRTSLSINNVVVKVVLLTSLTLVFVVALRLNFGAHRLPSNVIARSLPASLITAPEGAVGYAQPLPGPVAFSSLPPGTMNAPTSTSRELSHDLHGVTPAASGSTNIEHGNFITLTQTGTVTVTQSVVTAIPSGMASNGIVFGTAGLCLTTLLCLLLL